MTETVRRMIVHHADRLHESITDRTADKLEPPFFQVLAHRVALRGLVGNILDGFPIILPWSVPGKRPNIRSESTEFFFHLQESLGVAANRKHLQPIPDDSRIVEKFFQLFVRKLR